MAPVSTERDLRLDLFRGLALWLIFLDHIPSNAVSWITIRNYGFSDATEIFVFISGYTAAFVYGRAMREHGFIVGSARLLKRTWQIYVAHVFLFAIYLAEISYVAHTFDNPLYSEEMGVLDFLKNPDVTIIQALLLKFKPVNMDVLPLYIALLACFSPMLWLLLRAPSMALLASATLYALMWQFDWNIPAYPHGVWVFNPFAWQLLFVFGAWCALGGAQRTVALDQFAGDASALAIAYLLFAFFIAMTWYIPRLGIFVPNSSAKRSTRSTRPISTSCAFCISCRWPSSRSGSCRATGRRLKSKLLWPMIVCGQHSLEIFCLGVFLSFAGHFVFTEVSNRLPTQIIVSIAGIVIMVGFAALISWYRGVERRGPGPRPPAAKPEFAGGDA